MSYETVLSLHFVSFLWNIGWVVVADSIGLLWVLGKVGQLPEKVVGVIHKLIWLGVIVSIATGFYMFLELREYLLATPAFYTKMFFLVALIINALFISHHLKVAKGAESFKALAGNVKRAFFLSGAVSTISWVVVVVSAYNLGL